MMVGKMQRKTTKGVTVPKQEKLIDASMIRMSSVFNLALLFPICFKNYLAFQSFDVEWT